MLHTIVISAGGKGTRMGNLTNDLPKHLIPVNGRPFISYLLNNVIKAGFTNIIVNIGYKKERWASLFPRLPVAVTVINQHDRLGDKYGTACPIEAAEAEIGGQSFVAVNGDNLYSVNDLKRIANDDDFCYATGWKHDHPERYGVLQTDGDFLRAIIERPTTYVGDLINTGLYKFTHQIFSVVKQLRVSPRGEYEITDAINRLAELKLAKVLPLQDYWYDFGRPEDIDKVADFLKTQDT